MIDFLAVRPIMWLRVNPRPPGRDERMRHTQFAEISMRSLARLAGRFGLLAIIGLTLAGCGVNNIPSQEEAAKAKWSQVLNQYQRRADLIPNLVETVKGYAKQEAQVLEAVVAARARATSVQVPPDILTNPEAFKKFQEAQSQLSGSLGRLLAISENYPDLKSNQNFLALQSQLEGTENRISVARRDYIEAVQAYNTELKTFPGVIWASTLYKGNKPMETFTIAEETKRPPQVKF
jgi:LemA protein